MIEFVSESGSKFYLPMHAIHIIEKDKIGKLVLCYENPEGKLDWRPVISFSVMPEAKKVA